MNPTFNNSLVLIMQSFFLGALFISLAVCFFLYKSKSDYFLAFVPMLALSVHQVEEYVFSPLLFGEYHHFLNWAFRNGMDISPIEVTLVNLAPYVFFFPTLIFLRKKYEKVFGIFFLFHNAATMANASFHLGISTAQNLYSPGMISALLLFIPLFIYGILFNKELKLGNRPIIAISIYGFLAHFIMIWLINIF